MFEFFKNNNYYYLIFFVGFFFRFRNSDGSVSRRDDRYSAPHVHGKRVQLSLVVTVGLNPKQELKCARNLLRFAEICSAAILVLRGFQEIM